MNSYGIFFNSQAFPFWIAINTWFIWVDHLAIALWNACINRGPMIFVHLVRLGIWFIHFAQINSTYCIIDIVCKRKECKVIIPTNFLFIYESVLRCAKWLLLTILRLRGSNNNDRVIILILTMHIPYNSHMISFHETNIIFLHVYTFIFKLILVLWCCTFPVPANKCVVTQCSYAMGVQDNNITCGIFQCCLVPVFKHLKTFVRLTCIKIDWCM